MLICLCAYQRCVLVLLSLCACRDDRRSQTQTQPDAGAGVDADAGADAGADAKTLTAWAGIEELLRLGPRLAFSLEMPGARQGRKSQREIWSKSGRGFERISDFFALFFGQMFGICLCLTKPDQRTRPQPQRTTRSIAFGRWRIQVRGLLAHRTGT